MRESSCTSFHFALRGQRFPRARFLQNALYDYGQQACSNSQNYVCSRPSTVHLAPLLQYFGIWLPANSTGRGLCRSIQCFGCSTFVFARFVWFGFQVPPPHPLVQAQADQCNCCQCVQHLCWPRTDDISPAPWTPVAVGFFQQRRVNSPGSGSCSPFEFERQAAICLLYGNS